MSINHERLTFTVPEAGRIIGISRGCAYEAARSGQIPTIRIGGRLVVPKAALMKMLEASDSRQPGTAALTARG
jgi:excisionase family DNA binding protein